MDNIENQAHKFYQDSWLKEEKGKIIEAIDLIQKAIDLIPNVSVYWTTKAQYLYELQNYKEALITVDKAINLKPRNFHAWSLKGSIKNDIGKYEEAAEAYTQSVEINPDFSIYTLLAETQLHFDPQASIQSAKKALELNPDWDEAKNILEDALKKLKEDK